MEQRLHVKRNAFRRWLGPNGEEFCDLNRLFYLDGIEEVDLVVSDEMNEDAFPLVLDGLLLYVKDNGLTGLFFNSAEKWLIPLVKQGGMCIYVEYGNDNY